MGLNLAVAGVWRDWDATQPAGSTLCLDLEDLKHTDDEVLTRLMAIYDLAEELESELAGRSAPS